MEGVSPSVLVPAQSKSKRLATNARWAECVRKGGQRERKEASTALRGMFGTALACDTKGTAKSKASKQWLWFQLR